MSAFSALKARTGRTGRIPLSGNNHSPPFNSVDQVYFSVHARPCVFIIRRCDVYSRGYAGNVLRVTQRAKIIAWEMVVVFI